MPNTKNPFDFSNLLKQMDPAKMAEQFQEMLSNSPIGNFDSEAFAQTQRKNLEAVMEANQAVVSGAQALLERQSEMVQKALAEGAEAIQTIADSKPEEVINKNAKAIEEAIGQSMDNFTEIATMVQQTYENVSESVEKQIDQNITELREKLAKSK